MPIFPHRLLILFLGWFVGLQPFLPAQELDGRDGRDLALRLFRPIPTLQVEQHHLRSAKFPVVDVHSHLIYKWERKYGDVEPYVDVMNRNRIAVSVSLDGRLGEQFEQHLRLIDNKHRKRFVIFANINWVGNGDRDESSTWDCHRADFVHHTVELLRAAVQRGASGLKLFKGFGLRYKDADEVLVRIDDERWDPICAECGDLGIPVIMHIADPAAFFQPIDETNERWEELYRHPDWSFYGDQYPSRDELLAARNRIISRHPNTIFIGAHMANNAEDLAAIGRWLDDFPNLYVETASRISELGRQPYTARKFFLKYSDRILFGTDGPWPEQRLWLYWRFLETFDEYFPYSEKEFPPQGFWRIYGIGLPDDVLRKIYHENAARVIPGIRERVDTYQANQKN